MSEMDTKRYDLTMRALTAETNEATFRYLAQEALDILLGLPDTTPAIERLKFRIFDALSNTKSVEDRTEGQATQ